MFRHPTSGGPSALASRDSVATEVTRWTHGFRLLTSAATGSGLVRSLALPNDENLHSPGPGAIFIWLRWFSEAGSFVTCRPGYPRYTQAMRVLIVGCGYVGLPLGAELGEQGHEGNGV